MADPHVAAFERWRGTDRYIADPGLCATVNVAIALGRPLLIKGEPGTGKTMLAEAIAEGLGLPLHRWHVKSTTRGIDGLYVYDAVARLQDSRFQDRDVRDISQYIRLGPLGLAFDSPGRSVVLIDEIDKADLEFPNDLLHELDAMRFVIAETGREVVARERPILVITSNAEKELPDAFLRRAVFHCIDFPDEERLRAICRVHHPEVEERLLAAALRRFLELRAVRDMRKRPSTSELIDWIAGLRVAGIDPERLERSLPFLGVLVKDETDVGRVTRATEARAAATGSKTTAEDGRRWGRT